VDEATSRSTLFRDYYIDLENVTVRALISPSVKWAIPQRSCEAPRLGTAATAADCYSLNHIS